MYPMQQDNIRERIEKKYSKKEKEKKVYEIVRKQNDFQNKIIAIQNEFREAYRLRIEALKKFRKSQALQNELLGLDKIKKELELEYKE